MKQYLNLLQDILDNGIRQSNRTGIDTFTLPGAMLKFDLREGFPSVTTKKLMWSAVKGELIGFLEGTSSLARFKELGCNVWDANASAPAWQSNPICQGEDDLGRIYGKQWVGWNDTQIASDYESAEYLASQGFIQTVYEYEDGSEVYAMSRTINQIANALETIRNNPESRRIIVNAWNPADINNAALPPCHVLFQLLPHVESKVLHMTMYQRSCDMFLGIPFNIASYALLLELFCYWTGYTAGTLTMFLADAHIYVNHIEQVKEQLTREPKKLPKLWVESKAGPSIVQTLDIDTLVASLDPNKLHLLDYDYWPAIRAEMAV